MRSFRNIERSPFRKGQYTGYSAGLVWHIRKDGCYWIAHAQGANVRVSSRTLEGLSSELDYVDMVGLSVAHPLPA